MEEALRPQRTPHVHLHPIHNFMTPTTTHPDFALLSAPTLAKPPSSWVATMDHDPLRDESHVLAQRIEQAGVATEHRHYPGAIHACIHFTAVSPLSGHVLRDLAQCLRSRLASDGR